MHQNPIIFPYLVKEIKKNLLELIFVDFDYMQMLRCVPTK